MKLRSFFVAAILLTLGTVVVAWSYGNLGASRRQFDYEAELARREAQRIRAHTVLYTRERVPRAVAFADFLSRLGLERATVAAITQEAQRVFDLRKVRAGNLLTLGRSLDGELRSVKYQIDPDRELRVAPAGGSFRAEINDIPHTMEVAAVGGELRGSLFLSVMDIGEGPELALELANIFAWDLDFYTDPRPGDTFRVLVEKKTYRNGQPPRYGRVLAAEYNNAGRPYQAVLFREPSGAPAYYAPDGKSLKKAFLKSPLKFAAPVTSRFSRSRFHPVLKVRRPHLGTDYGAPTGTPVQAIAEGTVVFAGRKGGNGKYVHLRHANGYESMYLHLSAIRVRPGARVRQGQLIGRVGATGLASGPHLDFRIRQHGHFRNFESLRLPPAHPVAKADRPEFERVRDERMRGLPDLNLLLARQAGEESPALATD